VLPPKKDEMRFVKLTPRVIEAVNAHPANIKGDYLWSTKRHSANAQRISKKGDRMRNIVSLFSRPFIKACADLGIRRRSTYKTRSTYASIGLSAGRSAESLAKQLAHSVQVFYKHYGTLMQNNEMLDDEQARVLAFEERQMAEVREEAKKPKFL
jgi:integrase